MRLSGRPFESFRFLLFSATILLAGISVTANAFDWTPYQEDSTIEIITLDEDGEGRETKIWIVVLDETGFIRTNDSRWLANIRRGSAVRLRVREVETPVAVEIVDDTAIYDRVEQAFKDKYGLMQRVMSAFRTSRPTVMRITTGAAE
ncbi:MAG: DUF2255 family protein [Deltaproteobacteria bacterium]|nr:DUF2255 family protein [Deltaproteobacteria bacterium]MBW2389428.1 DUF2255 family protein [Deltaproteobacteria bacterium]MBW2725300.1 DUF2255 family protein [Deltaproteobacteria bacterium]